MTHPSIHSRRALCGWFVTLAALAVGGRLVAADLPLLEEEAMKAAVARVAPAVVRIETVGGLERLGELLVGTGATTGLAVSEDGYIISSAFSFAQKPDSILVTLADGSRSGAKLVATDHNRQLVLLKINSEARLSVPELAPSDRMRVGQWAIAIGRTYEGGSPNLSVGIISALDRIWSKAIQTDAKISPSNYGGPLVDISGRVLGVLVPLAPDAGSEVAGVDWYDSGIGFAVPLDHIQKILPRLTAGEDLYPGLMGISMEGADLFSLPAVIAACRANSPAAKAGLKRGDKIVEAGGRPITRQAELKHQLGSRYAGDKIVVAVLRGTDRVECELELVAKLEPYEYPFLGILPIRPVVEKPTEVIVRYVYPDGPAAKAGVLAGDRIVTVAGTAVATASAIAQQLNSLAPGETMELEIQRGEEKTKLDVELGRLPEQAPGDLPTAHSTPPPLEGERPQVGMIDLKLPDQENECVAYVPQNYHPAAPCGVVIWLHAPGAVEQQALIDRWKPLCEAHDLILLAPKSADPKKWQPTEARFVRRTLNELVKTYRVDPARIVVHGQEGGGALAYLVAASNPDLIRGVAAVEAALPAGMTPPETDPVHRLAFYIASAGKAQQAGRIEATIKLLRAMKYPVTVKPLGDQARSLLPDELAELARWIDTLDRL